jgi:hypothetical protein
MQTQESMGAEPKPQAAWNSLCVSVSSSEAGG